MKYKMLIKVIVVLVITLFSIEDKVHAQQVDSKNLLKFTKTKSGKIPDWKDVVGGYKLENYQYQKGDMIFKVVDKNFELLKGEFDGINLKYYIVGKETDKNTCRTAYNWLTKERTIESILN